MRRKVKELKNDSPVEGSAISCHMSLPARPLTSLRLSQTSDSDVTRSGEDGPLYLFRWRNMSSISVFMFSGKMAAKLAAREGGDLTVIHSRGRGRGRHVITGRTETTPGDKLPTYYQTLTSPWVRSCDGRPLQADGVVTFVTIRNQ